MTNSRNQKVPSLKQFKREILDTLRIRKTKPLPGLNNSSWDFGNEMTPGGPENT